MGDSSSIKDCPNIQIFRAILTSAKKDNKIRSILKRTKMVSVSKNFLVFLLVLSTMTLCLARPRWVWLREEEKNSENSNDEVFTREIQKDDNLMKEGKRKIGKVTGCPYPVCPPWGG